MGFITTCLRVVWAWKLGNFCSMKGGLRKEHDCRRLLAHLPSSLNSSATPTAAACGVCVRISAASTWNWWMGGNDWRWRQLMAAPVALWPLLHFCAPLNWKWAEDECVALQGLYLFLAAFLLPYMATVRQEYFKLLAFRAVVLQHNQIRLARVPSVKPNPWAGGCYLCFSDGMIRGCLAEVGLVSVLPRSM